MRTTALITLALLTVPAYAATHNDFNQFCFENEAVIESVQQIETIAPESALGCHRGQLGPEDLAQMESVRPSAQEPRFQPVITGLSAHRGQLGSEDMAIIQSTQPEDAFCVLN